VDLLADLRGHLQDKCEPPVYVSDRRLVKAVALMQARARPVGAARRRPARRAAAASAACVLLHATPRSSDGGRGSRRTRVAVRAARPPRGAPPRPPVGAHRSACAGSHARRSLIRVSDAGAHVLQRRRIPIGNSTFPRQHDAFVGDWATAGRHSGVGSR